jgi:hypothetical protein
MKVRPEQLELFLWSSNGKIRYFDNQPKAKSRTLKIEADGDQCYGKIKPKIRLRGKWLERAGFKPGNRVSVKCIAEGIMELRSDNSPAFMLNENSQI